jgi:hypothetical protein
MATMVWIGGVSPVKQRLQQVAQRFEREPHPLRRPVDRAETTTMTMLVAAFVIAWLVVSLVVGQAADAAGLRQQRAEQGWRQVNATLLKSAAQQANSSADWGAAWVPAQWKAPDGLQRTGQIATALNARAGQRVAIWVTSDGQVTHSPLTAIGIEDQVSFAILSVTIGAAVLLSAAAASIRVLFNRRRLACWQKDWDAVGPLWSRR